MKEIKINHDFLYIKKIELDKNYPNILFIHGGPGFSSIVFEKFITSLGFYKNLKANILIYDPKRLWTI